MVGPGGFEPPTPALSTRCSNQLSYGPNKKSLPIGGADRDRTDDLLNANQALFQLSYGPEVNWPIVGLRTKWKRRTSSSKTILCDLKMGQSVSKHKHKQVSIDLTT